MEGTYLKSVSIKNKWKCQDMIHFLRNYHPYVFPCRANYYTCGFCKREFKSAQALGGHMNIHRKDRAKLRESTSSWVSESSSNPNPNYETKVALLSSPSSPSPIFSSYTHKAEEHQTVMSSSSSSSQRSAFLHQQWKSLAINGDCHDFLKPSPDNMARKERMKHFAAAEGEFELWKKERPLKLDFSLGWLNDPKEHLDLELRL